MKTKLIVSSRALSVLLDSCEIPNSQENEIPISCALSTLGIPSLCRKEIMVELGACQSFIVLTSGFTLLKLKYLVSILEEQPITLLFDKYNHNIQISHAIL